MKYGTREGIKWEHRRATICKWERMGRKVGIGKIESMHIWKKKMGRYQENLNFGKYEIGKY